MLSGTVWVGIGGVMGALLRYQMSKWIGQRFGVEFPSATLFINVSGSFVLGLLTRCLASWLPGSHEQATLLLGTGFCGAYTTFSTFQYELTMLIRERRTLTALVYGSVSLTFGLAASAVGLFGFQSK